MARRRKARSGLILLVVLGMLALLSLLSVTYLVFSLSRERLRFNWPVATIAARQLTNCSIKPRIRLFVARPTAVRRYGSTIFSATCTVNRPAIRFKPMGPVQLQR